MLHVHGRIWGPHTKRHEPTDESAAHLVLHCSELLLYLFLKVFVTFVVSLFTKKQVDKAGLSLMSKIFTSFSNLG